MRGCSVCKIECERPLQCSKCQKTIYCSADCQKVDWKAHKRSVCAKPAELHKLDELLRKYSGPGSAMHSLMRMEDAAWEDRRRNPTPVSTCDGCFRRFRGAPIEKEYENENAGDAGERSKGKRCTECDYTICEECTHPDKQGHYFFEPPRGTCRCAKSNFGVSYCLSSPFHLDGDRREPYHGDRHPPMVGSGYADNAYEAKSRPCKTCGVVARCLKKEHLKDVMPGMI